jgi:hypothetical protein
MKMTQGMHIEKTLISVRISLNDEGGLTRVKTLWSKLIVLKKGTMLNRICYSCGHTWTAHVFKVEYKQEHRIQVERNRFLPVTSVIWNY